MDDKTAELRDIFLEVSDEGTVTESQEESRGSLADDSPVETRLRTVVEEMRDRYDFRTDLTDDALIAVVRSVYAGHDDAAIADGIDGADRKAVVRARFDLHLLRETDFDAPFEVDRLRDLIADGHAPEAAARSLGDDPDLDIEVDVDEIRRVAAALETRAEIRAVGDRYRERFEEILEDRDLRDRLVATVREDGLEDATEGMETNVSF